MAITKTKSKTLYAVLCGINEYPIAMHKLEGAVNDMQAMHEYLEKTCDSQGISYRPLILEDAQATYQAVIDAFSHFNEAEDDDIGVFYFSGHGSVCELPHSSKFRYMEPDDTVETLVCFDSRQRGRQEARDISNKELSWLIWNACRGKKIQFTAIVDSCHSGRITRSDEEQRSRKIRGKILERQITEFKGFKDFIYLGKGQFVPPRGRHVLLAAAAEKELAREAIFKINGESKKRGIFTRYLIQVLQELGPVSYLKLKEELQTRVKHLSSQQTPQVNAMYTVDTKKSFLGLGQDAVSENPFNGEEIIEAEPVYALQYEEKAKDWVIRYNFIDNLSNGTELKFKVVGVDLEIVAKQIQPEKIIIGAIEGLKKSGKKYKVVLQEPRLNDPLVFGFTPDNDQDRIAHFKKSFKRRPYIHFDLSENGGAKFLIETKNEQWRLLEEGNPQPVIPFIGDQLEENPLTKFLGRLNKFANWERNRLIKFPGNTLPKNAYELKYYKVTPSGETALDLKEKIEFRHKQEGHPPKCKIVIKNTGAESLYASILHFKADYSIDNGIMAMEEIMPGGQGVAFYATDKRDKNNVTDEIPLIFHPNLQEAGYKAVKEYFKVIISTLPFSTDALSQHGIFKRRVRDGISDDKVKLPFWDTVDIAYTLYCP